MTRQGYGALQRAGETRDPFHAAANLAIRGEYGSLIVNRAGRIVSCGVAAERVFGASDGRLIGKRISELIGGLVVDSDAPSYAARYLAFLGAGGKWHQFEAFEIDGSRFDVDLSLSPMVTDGQEIFLVNLRRRDGHLKSDVGATTMTVGSEGTLDRLPQQAEPVGVQEQQQTLSRRSRSGSDRTPHVAAH